MEICILLATFNGEKFLSEQLKSLLNQTNEQWNCLIRDDNSTDGTIRIIKKFCSLDSRFIRVYDDNGGQGNAGKNFALLINEGLKTNANYFFFCDQDDIWHNKKIEIIYEKLKTINLNNPLLIHHDLEVVNDNLAKISDSFISFSKLDPNAKFSQLLAKKCCYRLCFCWK